MATMRWSLRAGTRKQLPVIAAASKQPQASAIASATTSRPMSQAHMVRTDISRSVFSADGTRGDRAGLASLSNGGLCRFSGKPQYLRVSSFPDADVSWRWHGLNVVRKQTRILVRSRADIVDGRTIVIIGPDAPPMNVSRVSALAGTVLESCEAVVKNCIRRVQPSLVCVQKHRPTVIDCL